MTVIQELAEHIEKEMSKEDLEGLRRETVQLFRAWFKELETGNYSIASALAATKLLSAAASKTAKADAEEHGGPEPFKGATDTVDAAISLVILKKLDLKGL